MVKGDMWTKIPGYQHETNTAQESLKKEVAQEVLDELQRIEAIRNQLEKDDPRQLVQNLRDGLAEWREWQALGLGDKRKGSETERLDAWRVWKDPSRKGRNLGNTIRKTDKQVIQEKIKDNNDFATGMYNDFKKELQTIISKKESLTRPAGDQVPLGDKTTLSISQAPTVHSDATSAASHNHTNSVNPIEDEHSHDQAGSSASHDTAGQSRTVLSVPTYNGSVSVKENQCCPDQTAPSSSQDSATKSDTVNPPVPEYNLEKDIKVRVLEFETGKDNCHECDRVITLKQMLSKDFEKPQSEGKIRYFHIPYNNMQVSRLNSSYGA
jgi:hypothetical protein